MDVLKPLCPECRELECQCEAIAAEMDFTPDDGWVSIEPWLRLHPKMDRSEALAELSMQEDISCYDCETDDPPEALCSGIGCTEVNPTHEHRPEELWFCPEHAQESETIAERMKEIVGLAL